MGEKLDGLIISTNKPIVPRIRVRRLVLMEQAVVGAMVEFYIVPKIIMLINGEVAI